MSYTLTKENHETFPNDIKQYDLVESVNMLFREGDGYISVIRFKEDVLLLTPHSNRFCYTNNIAIYEDEKIDLYNSTGYKMPIVEYMETWDYY